MKDKFTFSVYGISIEHPKDWEVFVNPNKSFTKNKGLFKIQEPSTNKDDQISLGMQWNHAEMNSEDFILKYSEEIETQYKKRFKKTEKYNLLEKKIVDISGHDSIFIKSKIVANHGIYRALRKNETLYIIQVSLLDDYSSRIIACSVTMTEQKFENEKDIIYDILKSIKC